jgi:hypothetical protein
MPFETEPSHARARFPRSSDARVGGLTQRGLTVDPTPIRIEPTSSTPLVDLRPGERRLTVEGDCYPENPPLFFDPLLEAIAVAVDRDPAAPFKAVFRLRYANSSSARALRRVFVLLDRAAQRGPDVSIAWEHDADDADSPELLSALADGLQFVDVETRAIEAA